MKKIYACFFALALLGSALAVNPNPPPSNPPLVLPAGGTAPVTLADRLNAVAADVTALRAQLSGLSGGSFIAASERSNITFKTEAATNFIAAADRSNITFKAEAATNFIPVSVQPTLLTTGMGATTVMTNVINGATQLVEYTYGLLQE